jgi:hypothetical protein
MGWGLDFLWHHLAHDGCALGIVDAVSLMHLARAGTDYEIAPERARVDAFIAERRLTNIGDIQQVLWAWRVWQRHPLWL